eukprot:TRINITY_DN1845_c0_g1_i3.p1 TRINITY_DN1845_c0_g1~~TRINITY_DN1845_c0_g1_i3.p1  ORF type:complete len:354 (-),score=78.96 TRINITY_DN1845_c0_g1_i3:99-1160(-)
MTSKFSERNQLYRGLATKVGKKEILLDPVEMWRSEEALTIDERRGRYHCRSQYIKPEDILSWQGFLEEEKRSKFYKPPNPHDIVFPPNKQFNKKLSLWQGDITRLEIDAIVNAANRGCLGGGGVDGAIHGAAGDGLYNECRTLGGCPTGFAKITRGYDLPSKYVIHTVGPIISMSPSKKDEALLASAYKSCLDIVKEFEIKTVAFCGVSTGVYNYPRESAARTALTTIRNWLEQPENFDSIDKIIICTFTSSDQYSYIDTMPLFFPLPIETPETSVELNSSSSSSSETSLSFPEVPTHVPSENDNQGVFFTEENKANESVNNNSEVSGENNKVSDDKNGGENVREGKLDEKEN